MIKILYTLPALDGGGAEKVIYDYVIRMSKEFSFDFIVHSNYKGILEEQLEKMGCAIYHIQPLREGAQAYVKSIKRIISNGKYDIIHINQGYRGLIFLAIAKWYGIKVRIVHSHMAWIPESLIEKVKRYISTPLVKLFSTDLFACGKDAALWMWGERLVKKGKVHIMINAISFDAYKFSQDKRDCIRQEMHLENKFIVGNVARFSYQKNHEFIIKTFEEISKIREDAILVLVGRGELEEDAYNFVEQHSHLLNKVKFLGVRNDVPDLMNAMDIFLLPSRFEGLPVTLVEAQTNGLYCYVSDSVTKEIKVSDIIEYYSLLESPKKWAENICSSYKKIDRNIIAISDRYNIEIAYKEIEDYYRKRVIS